ncbi:MAG: hypothetical protein WCA63_11645 [Gallionella sp.]
MSCEMVRDILREVIPDGRITLVEQSNFRIQIGLMISTERDVELTDLRNFFAGAPFCSLLWHRCQHTPREADWGCIRKLTGAKQGVENSDSLPPIPGTKNDLELQPI